MNYRLKFLLSFAPLSSQNVLLQGNEFSGSDQQEEFVKLHQEEYIKTLTSSFSRAQSARYQHHTHHTTRLRGITSLPRERQKTSTFHLDFNNFPRLSSPKEKARKNLIIKSEKATGCRKNR